MQKEQIKELFERFENARYLLERLPPSEDVKKVKRRLDAEEKKIVGKTKKKTLR